MQALKGLNVAPTYMNPLHKAQIKLRRMRWADHVARIEEMNVYRILVGKFGGKGEG
jgi:hypothetical protein